ncbi:cysteine proteinase inhibitor 4-like [Triticum dicoccoides]|uniref:cysteine proteinase inhibitor 4-like n=1 Tax=Triticum dicoccoides TaxID=85692 RepID=UPI00162C6471|nr:cysteine proteinase inhibitor 4-like [Triticum dicoccoides]
MARVIGASGACTLLLVLLVACAASAARTEPGAARQLWDDGRKVGGRTEVRDVEGDREVQELGRYSVEEHNRRREEGCEGSGGVCGRLEFARVVSAQRQVVSGIKYYLRVAAAEEGGAGSNGVSDGRVFDAVVVVKPWLQSRALVRFAPADSK